MRRFGTGQGLWGRSGTGRETHEEVRDRSGDTQGGSGRV